MQYPGQPTVAGAGLRLAGSGWLAAEGRFR